MIRTTGEAADRDLEHRVRTFLAAHNVPALRRLTIEARSGTVTLSGRVLTFYEKQLSQQCPRRVAGVQQLVDRIVVVEGRKKTIRVAPDDRSITGANGRP